MQIFTQISLLFLFAIPVLYFTKKVKVPSIVGFIILGIILGRNGLGVIHNEETIQVLAEIGITILMFFIGLELSINKLKEFGKYVTILGTGQFVITVIIVTILSYFIIYNLKNSLFIGFTLVMSSTAIIMNHLISTNEIDTPQGNISFSISILQDLLVLPVLMVLPFLGTNNIEYSTSGLAIKILISFLIIAGIFVAAKFIVPKIVHLIAGFKSSEIFTLGIFFLILFISTITHYIGFSLAVGALITGIILSDSDYNYQIIADLLPFKSILNIFFFVAIGLLFEINFFISHIITICLVTITIIILKFIVVYAIVRLYGFPSRVAFISGLLLGQIGEFSFLILQYSDIYNILSQYQYNIIMSSTVISMMITPFLISNLSKKNIKILPEKTEKNQNIILRDHVIIIGYGITGQNLARVLRETGIKYVILELNPDTVQKYKNVENIVFGDATREEILLSVGIKNSKVVVMAISDYGAIKQILKVVRKINQNIYSIVRTKFVSEVQILLKLGADVVIPEEYETSLQVFSKVLEKYHIPLNIIMKQVALFRNEGYLFLREKESKININSIVESILAQGATETIYLTDDNPNVNKKLSELNLRAQTGTTIIAIIRDGKTISNPGGDEIILPKDTLVITGTHFGIDQALSILGTI
ncbi:MAG TPA: cation:proton antiporter [Ignavibacteriales bacterium]|nr:cation:proton antiporter [Ignavibacteriales bacterium]